MYTPHDLSYRHAELHRQDSLRRANRARLVREALAGQRGIVRLHQPLLALLGQKLVNWGTALQERYPSYNYGDDPLAYQPK